MLLRVVDVVDGVMSCRILLVLMTRDRRFWLNVDKVLTPLAFTFWVPGETC